MPRPRLVPAALVTLVCGTAQAQISPGPLSQPHAKLEGSGQCLACHDPRQGVSSAKCFGCHQPLQERVKAGLGLHARSDHADCKVCHVEHQGKDFELVYWGKSGRAAFDHRQTGHSLVGRHQRLACDQCHKTRSMLGLSTACVSCHKDPHRGEMKGKSCPACHTEEAWKPATGFDHGKTSFPLTGRHLTTACGRCHGPARLAVDGAIVRTFGAVAGKDCASCHDDVHEGRLGRNCVQCHTTAGWRGARPPGFDHSRTAYPLTGRHAGVACERCHVPGQRLRPRHERCADCHGDVHGAQFAARADGGNCESCHDVKAFVPARFGPEEHSRTAYPLVGAHLAVACNDCHPPRPPGAAGAEHRSVTPRRGPDFRRGARRCIDCHADPHGTGAVPAGMSCEDCHRVASWRQSHFDHGRTRFALTGRHERVACAACHRAAADRSKWRFVGVSTACASCHRDPHLGQFAAAGVTACERCHTTEDTRATGFDHGRDSSYPLDGAHKAVACALCHRTETKDGRAFVRYTPVPKTCRGCHGKRGASTPGERPCDAS